MRLGARNSRLPPFGKPQPYPGDTLLAGHEGFAVMHSSNRGHDGQPQAVVLNGVGARWIGAVETVEKSALVRRRYRFAGVFNGEHDGLAAFIRGRKIDAHRAARRAHAGFALQCGAGLRGGVMGLFVLGLVMLVILAAALLLFLATTLYIQSTHLIETRQTARLEVTVNGKVR